MTERYTHLAPENFVNTASSAEGRYHFDSTADNSEQTQGDENLQVSDLMGGKWCTRKGPN
jgi:hypothetical protein